MHKLTGLKISIVPLFIFLILIMLSLFTLSCSKKSDPGEKNLIPEKDLISILTDIHIANGLLAIPKINSAFSSLDSITTYYQVIEKHGYTRDEMDKTMKYYFIRNPKKLNRIYDQVMVILSKKEARIEKEALSEQQHKSNIWRGNDFILVPSASADSARFNLILRKPGFYILSYTLTLFPQDQSLNPLALFYSTSDSTDTGKRKYYSSAKYLKDGQPHNYSMQLPAQDEKGMYIKGSLFDFENHRPDVENNFMIENISILFSPQPL